MCPLPTPRPPWSIQPFPSYSDASQTTDDTWTSLRISMNMNAGRSLHSIRTSANNLLAAKIRLATLSNDRSIEFHDKRPLCKVCHQSINQSMFFCHQQPIGCSKKLMLFFLSSNTKSTEQKSVPETNLLYLTSITLKGQPNIQDFERKVKGVINASFSQCDLVWMHVYCVCTAEATIQRRPLAVWLLWQAQELSPLLPWYHQPRPPLLKNRFWCRVPCELWPVWIVRWMGGFPLAGAVD